jgi:hypothetical protein
MKYLGNIGNELAVCEEDGMHYIFDSDGREITRYNPDKLKETIEEYSRKEDRNTF